jgi:Baseplate J-like protein
VIPDPVVDGRRAESLFQELHRYAPQYTPDLSMSDPQSGGVALMRIFAHLAEAIVIRLGRTPHKHFVAFLDKLGIGLLPARPAQAAIAFRLATGLEESVRVPAGTRVTAAGPEDDIPFETTGELTAISGALVAAYGVDPSTDEIFHPPPDFLAQDVRPVSELLYEVQTFADAGSDRLQLNHVTELGPGSYIRIGCNDKRVVRTVEAGNIITLEQPLAAGVPAQTLVTPIRDFEVFSSIDLQEHVLYIGDADLFTVKQQAEISLTVGLVPGTGALQALNLQWQFWTKDENAPPENPDSEEHWEELAVQLDGTAGLSSSGSIVLLKPEGLEILEREVGGRTSRWIRAQLREPLPVNGRTLPDVDTIAIAVKSDQALGIPADQGFHNATPLDVQVQPGVGFLPFGTEPRQFDQFYIASEEAFSKRDATVTLKFQLDLQTLAAPAVVRTDRGLRAYSIGLRRRLYELDVASENWQILGSPADTGSTYVPVEDSVPSVITNATGDLIYAVVKTENAIDPDPANKAHKIWVNFHRSNEATSTWADLDAPPVGAGPKHVTFNPVAVALPGASPAFARVFVVGADGKLYSRDINNTPSASADWQPHDSPSGQPWASSPFVTTSGAIVLVFLTGGDGIVHRFDGTTWTALAPTSAFTAISRPFAEPIGAGSDAKVFVVGAEAGLTAGKLFECDTSVLLGTEFHWDDLGAPGGGIGIDRDVPAPVGFLETPAGTLDEEGKHIFLRGADNHLYERIDGEFGVGDPRWEKRTRPGDPDLRDSPAVLVTAGTPTTTLEVISASGRNSIVTWRFEITRGSASDLVGRAVQLLDTFASDVTVGTDFEITAGPGSGPAIEIIAYDEPRRLVRLASPLSATPTTASQCQIDGASAGAARAGANRLLALQDPPADALLANPVHVRIDDDFEDLDFFSRTTGVVMLTAAPPAGVIAFTLYVEVIPTRTEFLSAEDTTTVPELSWEYWNGRGWLSLTVVDGTRDLLANGDVVFIVPKSIERTEVAGQDSFWIRARLVGGDYGRETFKIVGTTVVSEKSSLRPPKVRQLRIVYQAPPVPPEVCLTFNNLDYLDQTAAAQTGAAHFRPFEPLEDSSLTLFLGFDRPFKTGPVRLLLDAAERAFNDSAPPELEWRFRKDRKWKPLDADDGSVALMRPGILTLSASDTLTRESRFGESLFWIKGTLRTDRGSNAADYPLPLLRGIFLNTVWAVQGETIVDEIVGSSDGDANQTIPLQHADVLEDEDIRIREPLSVEEREQIERESGDDSIVDREDIGGPWVRWRETVAFFDAGPNDRCYMIDRSTGVLQFGDGQHGGIPPAGVDNVRAFRYRTGGGSAGNVPAGQIAALASAVAGIESVFNPTAADGGSDKADTEAMLTIGPRRISHRDRAVSAEDFEELAYEASRKVAKVRCLSTTNLTRSGTGRADPCDPAQRHEAVTALGWVSLIVVPDSQAAQPCPSLELRRVVTDYLSQRAPLVLSAGERIVVRPPDYVVVEIEADLFVASFETASTTETLARATLETFLHPLRGGPDGTGWEFGRGLWKSDVFAVLEGIEDVDRVENLVFRFRGRSDSDRVQIGPNELIASGQHQLRIRKA